MKDFWKDNRYLSVTTKGHRNVTAYKKIKWLRVVLNIVITKILMIIRVLILRISKDFSKLVISEGFPRQDIQMKAIKVLIVEFSHAIAIRVTNLRWKTY